jgi:hypothetical protein
MPIYLTAEMEGPAKRKKTHQPYLTVSSETTLSLTQLPINLHGGAVYGCVHFPGNGEVGEKDNNNNMR